MANSPNYTISGKAADYLAKIIESATRLEYGTDFKEDIFLHRKNRIRTIHSSLAIEGNALSLGEVTALLEGKRVAGRQAEIKEVKNAYQAYDKIMTFNPYSVKDFLMAHKLMMQDMLDDAGSFRSADVAVFNGDRPIHIGARPQFVLDLVKDLFLCAENSDLHPLLKSAVLHYEIEIIHPFADGNGRMGRLWQTLLLAKWNEIFAWIPMETVLYQNREDYYEAIAKSSQAGDAVFFIEFTLEALWKSISSQKQKEGNSIELTKIQKQIFSSLKEAALSRREIFEKIGMNYDTRAFRRHMEPLLLAGLVRMTIPDKPRSSLQKYELTEAGKSMIE